MKVLYNPVSGTISFINHYLQTQTNNKLNKATIKCSKLNVLTLFYYKTIGFINFIFIQNFFTKMMLQK